MDDLCSGQVETLATIYHLELRPAEGSTAAKALYRTNQTAQTLPRGGILQVPSRHLCLQ